MGAADAFSDARGASLQIPFDAEEQLVGWYRNPSPWEESWVVFTDTAIYHGFPDRWDRIPFREVAHCEVPESKSDSTGVRLRTKDGIRFVRIAGRSGPQGRFSDAFMLVNLLRIVVRANLQRSNE